MKFKYQKHILAGPSHVERVWKLCYNRRKLMRFTLEHSPHGYSPCVLAQVGGDGFFHSSLSLFKYLISFDILPYV